MKTKFPSERGQAIILIALAIIGLLALTALAVDGGNIYAERRRAQNAADTTVLDAALAKVRGQNMYTEGLARAASNKYVDADPTAGSSSPDINVEIYNPPISGPYLGYAEYVQTIITARVPTYFGRVIGIHEVTNKVEAVARAKPPVFSPMFFGNAIVGLSPDDCKAVKYQGNANTTVIGGGIFVNSNCDDSAFFNNSSSAQLTAPCLQAVGGINYKPGAINIPSGCIISGAAPLPPPIYPNPTCSGNATKDDDVLSPGNYSGTFPPAGVTTLQSGVYCVNGDFRLNAHDVLNGDGVIIRVNNGDVVWNGGATINLSAPTSGPFSGLLLFLPDDNDNDVQINGNSGSTFTGTILAPSAAITINGTGGATGLNSQIIGYTVDLSGSSNTFINYNAGQNYQAPENPAVQLVQ
jgi:type II secretory pathway pseudopilin PulG